MNESLMLLTEFTDALTQHAPAYGVTLTPAQTEKLTQFYEHLLKWNDQLHLVAPCSPEEFATRHVLESLCAVPHLPHRARIVDIGSGGGLPAVPLMIVRPDVHITLIESSAKKYIYLHETCVKLVANSYPRIVTFRFEQAVLPPMQVLTCRALDRFTEKFPTLYEWVNVGCQLLLFAGPDMAATLDAQGLGYERQLLPNSEQRYLFTLTKS